MLLPKGNEAYEMVPFDPMRGAVSRLQDMGVYVGDIDFALAGILLGLLLYLVVLHVVLGIQVINKIAKALGNMRARFADSFPSYGEPTPVSGPRDAFTQVDLFPFEDMTVDALRNLAREWGLRNVGLKAELVDRLHSEAARRSSSACNMPRE